MPKKIVALSALVIITALVLPSCNHGSEPTPTSVLDPRILPASIELKIREDYSEFLRTKHPWSTLGPEKIWVGKFFGTFGDCMVVSMASCWGRPEMLPQPEDVAGYSIRSGDTLFAYKDSEFHTVKDAYGLGLLTKTDVYNIGKVVDGDFLRNNDPDAEYKLREGFIQFLENKYGGLDWDAERVGYWPAFWVSRDCVHFYVHNNGTLSGITDTTSPVEVAGHTIYFDNYDHLGQLEFRGEVYIYYQSSFYDLKEAFEAGYITEWDVVFVGYQIDRTFHDRYTEELNSLFPRVHVEPLDPPFSAAEVCYYGELC